MPPRAWSTGCYTCRCRRIKCDETKPECMKCKKGGKLCTGYRTAQQPVFRSTFVVPSDALIHTPGSHFISNTPVSLPLNFNVQPSIDWERVAMGRFLAHIIEPSSDVTPGFMEFLPEMMKWTFEGTRDALSAISLAHLANISNKRELQVKSKEHYGRALRSVHTALSDPASVANDTTLLNVVALQMYETIAGTLNVGTLSPHDKATIELVRLRHNISHTSEASRRLSELVSTRNEIQMLSTEISESEDPPAPLSPGLSFRLYLRKVSVACALLRSTRTKARGHTFVHDAALTDTLSRAMEVHEEITRWPKSTPVDWRYKPHIAPKDVADHGISQVFIFKNLQHGSMWQLYFCSRIHLCQDLLQTFDFLSEGNNLIPTYLSFGQPRKEIQNSIIAAVDDICSCAPFLLGDVDQEGHMNRSNIERKALGGFFLIRGLMVANSIEDLPPRQRKLLLNLLNRVGSQFGFQDAHRLREAWISNHKSEVEAEQLV